MANPEHLEILMQGVEAWNLWRAANRNLSPDLIEAPLKNASLGGAIFSGVDMVRADLSNADLRESILLHSNLHDANISNASLEGAVLSLASLWGTKLNGTNLRYAYFTGADLSMADLSGTDLQGAELGRANLSGAILVDADLSQARMWGTILTNVDLSEAKNLGLVAHSGPSSIGIDTIYKSQGHIPEVFLRGCGVSEELITYTRSLTVRRTKFYTCFISFTEANDAFSERLYNDLQAKGVRCWRWKEDAKWGNTLMRSIDEAIGIYDRLIVICSEQSLNAPAVIREIERALQKEDEQARQGEEGDVLFPIRLDDYIFTGWQHHRKADVTAKNVGDFTGWKDHDSYSKAFDRLMRDLKAGG